MALRRFLSRSSSTAGLLAGTSNLSGHGYGGPLGSSAIHQQIDRHFSGNYRGRPYVNENLGLPNVGMGRISMRPQEKHALPYSMLFRNFEHSGYPKIPQMGSFSRLRNLERSGNPNVPEAEGFSRLGNLGNSGYVKPPEMDGASRPMDYVRGLLQEDENSSFASPRFSRYGSLSSQLNVEQNADVVHIKILKNNTFVTLTDSKGNKKPGSQVSTSAGALPDKAGKNSRLVSEAAAEHVGRKARDIGVKSVVVRVNGFALFKRKRQAIMSFREGYSSFRGDQNPVVCIEDTTRRPHNGCRRRKQRRI